MEKKVKVLSTSTSCLDYYYEPHNVGIIRIKINLDDKEYADGSDITADEFYKYLRKNPEVVPRTSQPSAGELMELYLSYKEQGYTEIFVTTLSSKLSGSYNAAVLAANSVAADIKVTVYDTKTVCFPEGKLALAASEMFNAGKPLTEVISRLDYLRDNNTIFFAVDSLSYLVLNGRLSGASGFVGKLLKIKPILQVQETGEIISIEKIRTIKKALKSISNKVLAYTNGREYDAHVVYTGSPSLKELFLESVKEELGLTNLFEAPATPVVGCHVGPDVIGIAVFLK